MATLRQLLLGVLIGAGLVWAGSLHLLGLHTLTLFRANSGGNAIHVFLWLGVFLLLASNFVFMELVADRVIQVRRRGLLDGVELVTAAGMMLAVGLFVSMWLLGLPNG